eukprot:TRINITY_DN4143_c0_g1_i3.p1 TRINITY_DN4143_c0_g1~~TRINITY_DN4143_c0_g1_i3.p1  ORF type:complete len:1115 (-),score=312.37 TRINITY_DN4143_c0_g1_i3:105-3449(-)
MQLEMRAIFKKGLTDNAKLAFRILAQFTMCVADFEDVVEDQPTENLRKCLAFEEHLTCGDEEHKDLALKLLKYMVANMPKYSDWKALVNQDHNAIGDMIRDIPELSHRGSQHGASEMSHIHRRVHPPKGQFYDASPDQVLAIFDTNKDAGLRSDIVQERQKRYGLNKLPTKPPPSKWMMLVHQFADFIIIVLCVAVIISAATGDYKAAVALGVVIGVNTVIGFVQEVRADKALRGLASFSVAMAQVIRDGEQVEVSAEELVPGDVVVLDEGFQVPADLRLIEVAQLFVIESLLTGESEPVSKKIDKISTRKLVPIGDRNNMAFMSTLVTQGRGKGVVVNTALTTEVGRISAALGNGSGDTVKISLLQQKLARLGKWLVLASIISCALVVVIGVIRKLSDIVSIGISLAVSVIPEGLVLIVTLTLAVGTQKMAAQKAIVRLPPVVETLGAVTTICSDKTGTLTVGNMVVSEVLTDQSRVCFTTEKGDPHSGTYEMKNKKTDELVQPAKADAQFDLLMLTCAVCNNATLRKNEDPAVDKKWETLGDPTEVALLAASNKADMSLSVWEQKNYKKVHEISFTSDRKRMTVIATIPENSDYRDVFSASSQEQVAPTLVALSKGAADTILPRCSNFVRVAADGTTSIRPLDAQSRTDLEGECESLAGKGMRVLGLAIRGLSALPFGAADDSKESEDVQRRADEHAALIEKSMTFIGIVGIIDPPRPEVAGSVATCHEASIRVCMITGDHRVTAASIASTLGILPPNGRVMSGVELSAVSAEDLAKFHPFPNVFARVNPDDKLKIVQALQKRGEVVAMTGDGVNDAPAIKNADVGIAMGISGTEITRQAASMILTDDNFSTIVTAVREGRRVFDNIQKFLLYLLAVNFSQVVLMLSAISIGLPVPFTSLMILWANVFVAVPPSISLGVEPAEPTVMTRPPRDPKRGVLSKQKAFILGAHVCLLGFCALGVFGIAVNVDHFSDTYASSLAFATLFTLHVIHSFMARSINLSIFQIGLFGNKYLFFGGLASMFFIFLAIYTPGLNDLIELEPIKAIDWLRVLVAVAVHVTLVEIIKIYVRCFPEKANEHKGLEGFENLENDADERFKEIQIQMTEQQEADAHH